MQKEKIKAVALYEELKRQTKEKIEQLGKDFEDEKLEFILVRAREVTDYTNILIKLRNQVFDEIREEYEKSKKERA